VIKNPKGKITIGVVGKYVQHQDAYKSVYEALDHAAISCGYELEIKRFESDKIIVEGKVEQSLLGCDGYLVPGGFGERGWMGKILTAKYCRENKIPYFGICLGMQVLIVEFARHVANLSDANSTEMDPATKDPVISLLSEQAHVKNLGGTMRLGAYECALKEGTKAFEAYNSSSISERHRHRFESKGLIISGLWPEESLCEIAEIKDHPWMVGCQFHPEFKSKPTKAHPLFREFVKAVIKHKGKN
jgi:CTP synthase